MVSRDVGDYVNQQESIEEKKTSEILCPCHNCVDWVKCFSGEKDACKKFIQWCNEIIEKYNKRLEEKVEI